MDLFKDATYEKLDDISQLVEPYNFTINNQLAEMPDEIDLDADFFRKLVSYNSGRESLYEDTRKVIERVAKSLKLSELGEWSRLNRNFSREFFDIEIEDNTTYNAATKELTGGVKITKKKIAYDDKEIDEMLMSYLRDQFRSHLSRPSQVSKSRINEICDLFGATEGLKSRKASGKVTALYDRYKELFADRTLNIRDVDLFKRFVNWNVKYVKDGSLPSMSNITKVKIMMRSELPIYSIKEDEV